MRLVSAPKSKKHRTAVSPRCRFGAGGHQSFAFGYKASATLPHGLYGSLHGNVQTMRRICASTLLEIRRMSSCAGLHLLCLKCQRLRTCGTRPESPPAGQLHFPPSLCCSCLELRRSQAQASFEAQFSLAADGQLAEFLQALTPEQPLGFT